MSKNKSTKNLTTEQKDFYRGIRMIAVSKQPYISDAIFRLIPVSSPGLKTMAVDKEWRVYVDFEFMMEKGRDYAAATLAHEPWHLLRNHWKRAEEIGATGDHWNHAGDLEINDDILSLISNDFLIPGQGSYKHLKKGLTAEEYYHLIDPNKDIPPRPEPEDDDPQDSNEEPSEDESSDNGDNENTDNDDSNSPAGSGGNSEDDNADGNSDGSGETGETGETGEIGNPSNDANIGLCGSGATGGGKASYELDDDDEIVTETEEIAIRAQVAQNIKEYIKDNPDSVDESLQLWAEEVLAHKPLDWRKVFNSILRNSVNHVSGHKDYNKRIPHRRQPIEGILLPSMRSPKPRIAIGVDTSGSNIGKLGIITSEIGNILNKAGIRGRDMVAFSVDSAIEGKPKYVNDLKDLSYEGAGGTDLNKAFDYVAEKLHKDIDVFILMTDGEYNSWYDKKPARTGRIEYITCIVVDSKEEPYVTKNVIRNAEERLKWTKVVIIDIANM